jgi:hypothetical protein
MRKREAAQWLGFPIAVCFAGCLFSRSVDRKTLTHSMIPMKNWLNTARRFPLYTERVDSCDLWRRIAGAVSGCHSCFAVIWAWISPWRLKKAANGAYIELPWFVIVLRVCHVSVLSFIHMSDLMCNSVFFSALFLLSFASVNISLQTRGVFFSDILYSIVKCSET